VFREVKFFKLEMILVLEILAESGRSVGAVLVHFGH
jgi:hypothetical protein